MLQSNLTPLADQTFGDPNRAFTIHQKVVVDDPQELQSVARDQIGGLLDHLLRIERVPLSPVNSVVGAVAAVVGARQAGRVHGPPAPADALIGVEIGEMVGLRRKLANGFQRSGRVEDQASVFLIAHALDAAQRLARGDALDDFEHGVFALTFDDNVDVFRGERLIR